MDTQHPPKRFRRAYEVPRFKDRAPWQRRRRLCKLESCGVRFIPVQKHQKFCTPEHKKAWHFSTADFSRTRAEILELVQSDEVIAKVAARVAEILKVHPPAQVLVANIRDQVLSEVRRRFSLFPGS